MIDYFTYNSGDGIIPKESFRISPSQIHKFFDKTLEWYNDNLLGNKAYIDNTTPLELGNCVHAAAHMYHDTKAVDSSVINNYVKSLSDIGVDKELILHQWPIMASTLINSYLNSNKGTNAEMFIWHEILPGIVVGGSIDRYDSIGKKVVDYKTMGSLDKARLPQKIPRAYWFQQMTYVWTLRKLGYSVDYVELVYITRSNIERYNDKGKRLTDYPSTVHVVREVITETSMEIIENTLKTIAYSVKLWKEQPELRFALAQDFRMYIPPKPKLFKD